MWWILDANLGMSDSRGLLLTIHYWCSQNFRSVFWLISLGRDRIEIIFFLPLLFAINIFITICVNNYVELHIQVNNKEHQFWAERERVPALVLLLTGFVS